MKSLSFLSMHIPVTSTLEQECCDCQAYSLCRWAEIEYVKLYKHLRVWEGYAILYTQYMYTAHAIHMTHN